MRKRIVKPQNNETNSEIIRLAIRNGVLGQGEKSWPLLDKNLNIVVKHAERYMDGSEDNKKRQAKLDSAIFTNDYCRLIKFVRKNHPSLNFPKLDWKKIQRFLPEEKKQVFDFLKSIHVDPSKLTEREFKSVRRHLAVNDFVFLKAIRNLHRSRSVEEILKKQGFDVQVIQKAYGPDKFSEEATLTIAKRVGMVDENVGHVWLGLREGYANIFDSEDEALKLLPNQLLPKIYDDKYLSLNFFKQCVHPEEQEITRGRLTELYNERAKIEERFIDFLKVDTDEIAQRKGQAEANKFYGRSKMHLFRNQYNFEAAKTDIENNYYLRDFMHELYPNEYLEPVGKEEHQLNNNR